MNRKGMAIGDDRQESDEALISEVRKGSADAYAALYERHYDSARATAIRHAGNVSDAEDLVAEAFANVLQAIQSDKGPEVFFRAYLLTSLRRLAAVKRSGDDKSVPTDDLEQVAPVLHLADPAVSSFDKETVTRSFLKLPERWQAVLWYMEVEGMAPAAIAPILGMTPNAVSALAGRAREGLRQTFLQNHVSGDAADGCTDFTGQLGAYVRKGLTSRRSKKVQEHVDGCLSCTEMLLHLEDVGVGMRTIIFPGLVGLAFAGHSSLIATGAGIGAAGALVSSKFSPGSHGMSVGAVLTASVAGLALFGIAVASAMGLPHFGKSDSSLSAGAGKITASAEPPKTLPRGPAGMPPDDSVQKLATANRQSQSPVFTTEPTSVDAPLLNDVKVPTSGSWDTGDSIIPPRMVAPEPSATATAVPMTTVTASPTAGVDPSPSPSPSPTATVAPTIPGPSPSARFMVTGVLLSENSQTADLEIYLGVVDELEVAEPTVSFRVPRPWTGQLVKVSAPTGWVCTESPSLLVSTSTCMAETMPGTLESFIVSVPTWSIFGGYQVEIAASGKGATDFNTRLRFK